MTAWWPTVQVTSPTDIMGKYFYIHSKVTSVVKKVGIVPSLFLDLRLSLSRHLLFPPRTDGTQVRVLADF